MYRLLIVDDEFHVVDWLAELFKEQDSLELEIYKAYLAKDALDILEQVKIDIVLSDIRMPGMDGFELADRITVNWPRAKIIFLTGYNEFEYAYRANQYKNISFLLKTEDDDVIFQAVQRAVAFLEEEKKNLEIARDYIGLRQLMTWQVQKSILTEYLERGRSAKGMEQLKKEDIPFPFSVRKKAAVIGIRISEQKESLLEQEKLAVALQSLLGEMLFEKGDVGVLNGETGHFLAVFQSRNERSIVVYLREMLDDFSAAVLKSLGTHAFFTLYEKEVAFEEIREIYEVLKMAAADVADTGNLYGGRIVLSEEAEELSRTSGALFLDFSFRYRLERLPELLDQGKKQEFFQIFDEIYAVVTQVSSRHYYPAIEIFQKFSVMYLSRINQKKWVEKMAFHTALGRLMNLYDFENWTEAFDYLRDLGKILFQEQEEQQSDKNDAFLETVKQFVRENLKENLSLTYLSSRLHYNPSYISRLFKQLSGKNLSEYILDEKIAYAKKRLKESDDTVVTVAEKVGFESSQYFSVVFKKYTGMSPGEYRRKNA